MKNQKVFVMGHKNPDTDSICSAIAYADIKNRTTQTKRYIPRRAGQINEETQYVLNRFGVQPPAYLGNIGTQVKDMDIRPKPDADRTMSLKNAWDMMQNKGIVTLPICNSEDELEGIVTIGDIADVYMDTKDSYLLSNARTQYNKIRDTLDGEIVEGNGHGYFTKGKILIGTADPEVMKNYIEENDMVILGNREEDQLKAIELNVSCIIVGMSIQVSEKVIKKAQERQIIIISSPYDTYTIARMINQSIPVKYFMSRDNLEIFHLNDYVEHVKEVMSKTKYRDFPILDNKGKFCGFLSRRRLMTSRKKQVILVDHNEKSQAVNGIEEAEVQEIIDHHRLGGLETIGPVYFRNQPVGCTATIIYQMYQESGVEVEPQMAGLLCSAIISDTLLFRSPTCTMVDQAAAEALARIAGIDMEEHAKEMFNAGSNLRGKSVEEICFQDFKVFNVKDIMFGVGQITSMNQDELDEVKGRLIPYLEEARKTQGLHMLYLMMTNILEESTELLCCGENAKEQVLEAFELPGDTEKILLKGVVSRKKQMIPVLVTYLQQK